MSDFDRVRAAFDEVALANRVNKEAPGVQVQLRPRGDSRGTDSDKSAVIVGEGRMRSPGNPKRLDSGSSTQTYRTDTTAIPQSKVLGSLQAEVIVSSSVNQGASPFAAYQDPTRIPAGLGEPVVFGGINGNDQPAVLQRPRGGESVVLGGNNGLPQNGLQQNYVVPIGEPVVIGGINGRNGPEVLRSKTSGPEVLRSSGPEILRSSGPEVWRSSGPDVYRSSGPEVYRSSGPEVYRSSGPEVVRSSSASEFSSNVYNGTSQPFVQPYISPSEKERPATKGLGDAVIVGGRGALGSYAGQQGSFVSSSKALSRPMPGLGDPTRVNWSAENETRQFENEYYSPTTTRPSRMKSAVGTLDAGIKIQEEQQVQVATKEYMQSYDPDRTLPPANYRPYLAPEREVERRNPELVPEPATMSDLDSMDPDSLQAELDRLRVENAQWKEFEAEASTDGAQSITRKISEVRSWGISEFDRLRKQKDSLEYENNSLQQKYDQLKKGLSEAQNNQKRLEYEVSRARQDMATRDERLVRERRDVDEMKKGHSNLRREVQRAQRENPEAERKIQNTRLEQNTLHERIAQLRQTLEGNGALKERLLNAREQRIEDEIAIMQRANRALEIEIDTFRMGTYLEQPSPPGQMRVPADIGGFTADDTSYG